MSDFAASLLWTPWIGLGGAVAWLAPSALGLRRETAHTAPLSSWAAAFGSLVGAVVLPALAPALGLTSFTWNGLAFVGALVGGLTGRFYRRAASAVVYGLLFGLVMLAQTWLFGGLILMMWTAGQWAIVVDLIGALMPWVLGVSVTCGALIGLPINLFGPRPPAEDALRSLQP